MDASIHNRHQALHICRIWIEVCCTRMPYYTGERFNVFSHLVTFFVFVTWAILNQVFVHEGVAGTLQSVFLVSLATVFGVSTVYHVHQARPWWAQWLRVVDYLCIYAAMSVQSVLIVFLLSRTTPSQSLPWQSIADPIVAMVLVTTVTVGREVDVIAREIDTYVKMEPCDPCRYAHVDGDHTILRIGINILFVGQWIVYSCMIYDAIEPPYNIIFIGAMALSTIVLTLTQINDYYNLSGACNKLMPYPHGLFHVATAMSAVLIAGTNEIILRFSNR